VVFAAIITVIVYMVTNKKLEGSDKDNNNEL